MKKNDIKYTWKLEDIFKTEKDFYKEKSEVEKLIGTFKKFKGHLADSPKVLEDALNLYFELMRRVNKLYSYARCKFDADTKNQKFQAMKEEIDLLNQKFNDETSFLKPEILAIPDEKINEFLKKNKNLETYKHLFEEFSLARKHTLSPEEEKILAILGLSGGFSSIQSAPQKLYEIFSYADFKYPVLKLSNGEKITLTRQMYVKYRAIKNRKDRKKIFEAFFKALKDYQNTYATMYYEHVKKEIAYSKIRKFKNCIEAALFQNHIPEKIYEKMIENIHKNLPILHEYLKLKKKILGVKKLKYYDLYVPITKELSKKYDYEEGNEIILKALEPLGKDAVNIIKTGLNSRWADVFPKDGKRGGAYMDGAVYDVHPFVLLNYNGTYQSVSTTAHEFGHALHSYLSNKNQPYHYADYSIFLAEIASTLNENLLIRYMIKHAKTDEEKLFFIGEFLENFRTTVFRQAMFAEFEYIVHKKAEKGEILTANVLNKVYLDLLKKYYGHDKGIVDIDDIYASEWAYIPHFYYGFYVYQYVTGFISASSLSDKILKQGKPAREKYLEMLKSGASDFAINLLKKAGVDLATDTPYNEGFSLMKNLIEEASKIVNK